MRKSECGMRNWDPPSSQTDGTSVFAMATPRQDGAASMRPPARRGHGGLRPGGKVEKKKMGRWEKGKVEDGEVWKVELGMRKVE